MTAYIRRPPGVTYYLVTCDECLLETGHGTIHAATRRRDDHNNRYHRKETDR